MKHSCSLVYFWHYPKAWTRLKNSRSVFPFTNLHNKPNAIPDTTHTQHLMTKASPPATPNKETKFVIRVYKSGFPANLDILPTTFKPQTDCLVCQNWIWSNTGYFTPRDTHTDCSSEYKMRYWPIYKIAIFGHETWPLANVAHILSFYPRGSKLNYR